MNPELLADRLLAARAAAVRCAPCAGRSEAELAGCIAWVAHGFEIVQTHFDDWKFEAPDTVADFGLHGRLLVSPRVRRSLRSRRSARSSWHCASSCRKNSRVVDAGRGSVVLDGPLNALPLWLDAMLA